MIRRGGFGKGMRRRNVVTSTLAAKFQSFLNQHPADVLASLNGLADSMLHGALRLRADGRDSCAQHPAQKVQNNPMHSSRDTEIIGLKRDEIRMNRHRALAYCLSMISAQTRSAGVARENRFVSEVR